MQFILFPLSIVVSNSYILLTQKYSSALLASSGTKYNEKKDIFINWRLLKNINISAGIFVSFHILAWGDVLAKIVRCQRYIWIIEREKILIIHLYNFYGSIKTKGGSLKISSKIWPFLLLPGYFLKMLRSLLFDLILDNLIFVNAKNVF